MIRVVHQLRGRARFEVPRLRGSKPLAQYLERELPRSFGILVVSASHLTGRVLVRFGENETSESIVVLIHEVLERFPAMSADTALLDSTDTFGLFSGFSPGYARKSCPAWEEGVEYPVLEDTPAPWHTMESKQVMHQFQASFASGLSEASVRERQAKHGLNSLPGASPRSLLRIVNDQVSSFPILLTGAVAGLSAVSGKLIEGVLALGVALVNVAVGSIIEHRAEETLKTVREAVDLKARVLRDGQIREIPFDRIVLGDVLDLQVGSRIPADARLIQAEWLAIDESSLTGESLPVSKDPVALGLVDVPLSERYNMVFRGTLVVEGTGRAVVVATGQETVLAKLQCFLGEVFPPEALMARDLTNIAIRIMKLGLGACSILAVISLFRGYGLLRIARESISLLAGAVPSGLSTIAVSAFALGHRNLGRNRILVRRLRALGSLASVQVVCFDKTGTLTRNRMTVTELLAGGKRVKINEIELRAMSEEELSLNYPDILWLIRLCILCNETAGYAERDQESLEGSSTERALINLAEAAGLNHKSIREAHPILDIAHRTEELQFMVTVHPWTGEERLTAVKGSPLEVLDKCSQYAMDGKILPLDEDERYRVEVANSRMAGEGLRILGVAYSLSSPEEKTSCSLDASLLVWAGLVALEDPVRAEAKPLIQALHGAGIRTVVITGDQSLTARHIGEQLDLSGAAPLTILDSSNLRGHDSSTISSLVMRAHIFARLSPTQKLRVIQAYQSAGMSVIMVGDGFNDVLALKVADVGIAMGKEGADLARASADLVLEDDNLLSVMSAIATGRAYFHNIRKSLRFLVTANHVDLMAGLTQALSITGQGPSPWQSLWSNLICLSLALDRPDACHYGGQPVEPEEGILKAHDMEDSLSDAAALIAGASAAGAYGILRYGSGERANRLFLQSAAVNQLLYGLTCSEANGSSPSDVPPNAPLHLTFAAAASGYLLAALLPAIGKPIGEAASRILDLPALGAGGLLSRTLLERSPTRIMRTFRRYLFEALPTAFRNPR